MLQIKQQKVNYPKSSCKIIVNKLTITRYIAQVTKHNGSITRKSNKNAIYFNIYNISKDILGFPFKS